MCITDLVLAVLMCGTGIIGLTVLFVLKCPSAPLPFLLSIPHPSIRLPPFGPPSLSPFFLPSGVPSFTQQCDAHCGTPACARAGCGTPRCWHPALLALHICTFVYLHVCAFAHLYIYCHCYRHHRLFQAAQKKHTAEEGTSGGGGGSGSSRGGCSSSDNGSGGVACMVTVETTDNLSLSLVELEQGSFILFFSHLFPMCPCAFVIGGTIPIPLSLLLTAPLPPSLPPPVPFSFRSHSRISLPRSSLTFFLLYLSIYVFK